MANTEHIKQSVGSCGEKLQAIGTELGHMHEHQVTSIGYVAVGLGHLREAVAAFKAAEEEDNAALGVFDRIAALLVKADQAVAPLDLPASDNPDAKDIYPGLRDLDARLWNLDGMLEAHLINVQSSLQILGVTMPSTEEQNALFGYSASTTEDVVAAAGALQRACAEYSDGI